MSLSTVMVFPPISTVVGSVGGFGEGNAINSAKGGFGIGVPSIEGQTLF